MLSSKVKSEKLAEQYESYTSGLRSGASITVDDPKLDGIDVKPPHGPVWECLAVTSSPTQWGEKPEVVNDPVWGFYLRVYVPQPQVIALQQW